MIVVVQTAQRIYTDDLSLGRTGFYEKKMGKEDGKACRGGYPSENGFAILRFASLSRDFGFVRGKIAYRVLNEKINLGPRVL